jgi:trimeric autotransporter adhesin
MSALAAERGTKQESNTAGLATSGDQAILRGVGRGFLMKTGWIAVLLSAGLGTAAAQQYTISTFAGGAPPGTPVAATSTSFGAPRRVALDKAGNLYFSSLNSVFMLNTAGVVTLMAGNSRPGYSGDGGPASAATLNGPQGVAVDAFGNLYIADSNNNVVRMVNPSGIISTYAGNGIQTYAGDYGPPASASLYLPSGMAFDGSGNLYIADTGNNVIREISNGVISTFAGDGYQGYVGDSGPAVACALNQPTDVTIDSNGNVYIADTANEVIREVLASDGQIFTIVGNGTIGYSGDTFQSTSAQLFTPTGVAVDSGGNIYIAEFGDGRVRKATPDTVAPTVTTLSTGVTTTTLNSNSIITTIAGNGTSGFAGDGGPATSAILGTPWGIVLDSAGDLYVADVYNNRVRKIAAGGTITTVAGNGLLSYSGDGGAAAKAQLDEPQGVATDAAGNIYVADTVNQRVRKISPGGVINTIAGNGTAGFGGDGGPGTSAQLNNPVALAVDGSGNLYIADSNNQRVRMVTPAGVISTVAGSGTSGFAGDGGPALSAQFNNLTAVAVDGSGNVYVSDFTNNRVRKFAPGGTISTVAGNGSNGFSGDGGPAISAQLNGPTGLALDSSGNLYIADLNNSRIRIVNSAGQINTLVGNGNAAVSGDGGPASQAELAAPESLMMDPLGNLYIGDSWARVRKISPDGTISTIAGKGTVGYAGDGGAATSAQVNGPFGLAADSAGNLYIADTGNSAVRILQATSYNLTLSAVTNGASNATGAIAPGEIVTIYGTGLGPTQLTQFSLGATGGVASSLAGTRILINGIPAPVLYTWANQVGVVVPYGVTGSSAQVVAQFGSQTSAALTVPVATAAPALFSGNFSGTGQAVAANQNGSTNSAATPASAGSVIVLLATGTGRTNPPGVDGSISAAPLPQSAAPVTVTIGGQTAQVMYAGGAPGIVAGVTQINATIPSGITAGSAVPVLISVGGVSSPAGATIAVSQ